MQSILLNLAVGLMCSLLSGAAVLMWQRSLRLKSRRRRAEFLGFDQMKQCLIVLNQNPMAPGSMTHNDIYVAIEIASSVRGLGVDPIVMPFGEATRAFGAVAEFCIGGPESNPRTAAHLRNYLPRIRHIPWDPKRRDPDSLALVVGERFFRRVRGDEDYAVLARVFPSANSKPIFLLAGQTDIVNHAAAYYLFTNIDVIGRKYQTRAPFCLMLVLRNPHLYGYRAIELAEDVTGQVLHATAPS